MGSTAMSLKVEGIDGWVYIGFFFAPVPTTEVKKLIMLATVALT
jgi:hypothetical protein